ncbi:hypothetical protein ABZY44_23610 [Streptomyces sp. NPDC006544]|uniref:hypothetical protein n=1 Tax=Streptomyces sp. NPDC006544 TaxID=3154583 RepID=UPI0033ADEF82
MSRSELQHLPRYVTVLPRQRGGELVGPKDGKVHVLETQPEWLLDGWRPAPFFVGPVFLVRTPQPRDPAHNFQFDTAGVALPTRQQSCLLPCTAQTCRRWVEAAVAYATAVDDISAELLAALRRAGSVPRWRRFAAPLALRGWEQTRQRYDRVMHEASEAYKPVRLEILQAIQVVRDNAAEQARKEGEARGRRAEFAERPLWCWSMATDAQSTACVFRHDVPVGDGLGAASPQVEAPVDVSVLRRALKDQKPAHLRWDRAAITATERELEGVSFENWWRELFYEDYRTFTSPPRSQSSSRLIGGTGTGGTGGFTGGFHFGGY